MRRFRSFPGPTLWAYFYILPVGWLFRADAVRLPDGDGLVRLALPFVGGWRAVVVGVERQAIQVWRFHAASCETATHDPHKAEKHQFEYLICGIDYAVLKPLLKTTKSYRITELVHLSLFCCQI